MSARTIYVLAAVLFFVAAAFSAFASDLGLTFTTMWIGLGALFVALGFMRES